jgi:hypothetical protein
MNRKYNRPLERKNKHYSSEIILSNLRPCRDSLYKHAITFCAVDASSPIYRNTIQNDY